MDVLTIISRDLQKASTLFRVVQYLDYFNSRDIHFRFLQRKSLSRADLTSVRASDLLFNQKCLFNYSLAKRMIHESRRTLFDFDDAIFTRPGKPDSFITRLRERRRLKLWLTQSNVVTTPNQYLADYARKWSKVVEIIPMAIDLEQWRPPGREKTTNAAIVIGWAGAPVNIPLLESLNPILTELVNKNKNLRIAVLSGQRPRLDVAYDYYPFEAGKEAEFIQKLDIGLLPLRRDEFSMGKSPIKAIQYLACGVPVVGNVFGATSEILNERNSIAVNTRDEWIDGLRRLIAQPELIRSMGEAGREHVEAHHSMVQVREKFLKILCAA